MQTRPDQAIQVLPLEQEEEPPKRRLEDPDEPSSQPAQPAQPAQIQTGLQLTPEQLLKLEKDTIQRIVELKQSMGLEDGRTLRSNSFMALRERYQASYDGDYSWRKAVGGIFKLSNFSKGTNKKYVRKTAAKMRDDLMGTHPFFGVIPTRATQAGGQSKAKLAQHIEQYIQRRVYNSNAQFGIRMGQRVALIRNEAVIKITYLIEKTPYYDTATVLVDETGEPIKLPSGNLIFENDNFLADPVTEGLWVLEKEPVFKMAEGQYRFLPVQRVRLYQTRSENVDCRVLDHRSFLCPLDAENVHAADTVAQLMDLPVDSLEGLYNQTDTFKIYQNRMAVNEPVSGEKTPKAVHGEDEVETPSKLVQTLPVAEVYRRVDADGDGEPEELFLVIDLENQKLIFWDYLHRHMEKRPFEVIPGLEFVPNRWYGVGIFELMEDHSLYIDGQFNRVNNADSRNDTLRFRVRNAVKQWKDGSEVEYGTDETLDCESGFDAKNPPVFQVNLSEPSEMGVNLMRDMEQAGDLLFGSISAQDASASDLNQSKTATGILNLERVGDVLVKDAEIEQGEAIKAILEQIVTVLLENLDPVVSIYSGDESETTTLSRDEIRGIEKDVRLLLTRSRSAEQLSVNEKAEGIALRYFNLTPVQQFYLRPFYIHQLKSLEFPDADERLPQVTQEEMMAWIQQQQALAAQQQNEEAGKSGQNRPGSQK